MKSFNDDLQLRSDWYIPICNGGERLKDNEGNNFNFTYNSLGQKIQLDDPDLGKWKYEYDIYFNSK